MTIHPEEHLGIVGLVLRQLSVPEWQYDDCFSAGVEALVRAAKFYREGGGATWATYAHRAIKNAVINEWAFLDPMATRKDLPARPHYNPEPCDDAPTFARLLRMTDPTERFVVMQKAGLLGGKAFAATAGKRLGFSRQYSAFLRKDVADRLRGFYPERRANK